MEQCQTLISNFHQTSSKVSAWYMSSKSQKVFMWIHNKGPFTPESRSTPVLPLWKIGRIGNERALIGESVCLSKIQRGLVRPALRGRGERDQFFNRLKNGRGWSCSPQVVCWAGVKRGGRRYSVGWSYFDRVWSAIQRK